VDTRINGYKLNNLFNVQQIHVSPDIKIIKARGDNNLQSGSNSHLQSIETLHTPDSYRE